MKIELDVYHLQKPRKVSYPIAEDVQDVPAPFVPLFIERASEKYVYVRQIPVDFTDVQIRHSASELMTELALRRFPFNKNDVSVVLFDHPIGEGVRKNEIWIGRSLSRSGGYTPKRFYSGGGYTSSSRSISESYRSSYQSSSGITSTSYTHGGGFGRRGLINALGEQPLHPVVVLQ